MNEEQPLNRRSHTDVQAILTILSKRTNRLNASHTSSGFVDENAQPLESRSPDIDRQERDLK